MARIAFISRNPLPEDLEALRNAVPGIEYVPLSRSIGRRAQQLIALIRSGMYDVLHLTEEEHLFFLKWGGIGVKSKPKIILHLQTQGVTSSSLPSPLAGEGLGVRGKLFSPSSIISTIVVRSEIERQQCDQRAVVLPPALGPDATKEIPRRSELMKRLNLASNARLIAMPCQGATWPAIQNAIQAFDMLKFTQPGLHLLLANTREFTDRALDFAWQMGREETRILTREVGDDWLAADQIWYLRNQPTDPTALLQALAQGRPVLASDRPEIREWLGEPALARLIPNVNPPKLAGPAMEWFDYPGLMSTFAEQARLMYPKRFDFDKRVELFRGL
jgi:hypothetical protein